MNKFLKRLFAYIVDIAIISILVTLLTYNNKINFQYDNYQKYYKEYNSVSTKYNKVLDKDSKLEKKYKNKDIKKGKYAENKKVYKQEKKKYEKNIKILQRKIMRNSVIYYSIYMAFILAYFGIFQYSFNGQTLGKRLMKIKIISKKSDLNLWMMLLRSFILYNLWIYILGLIFAYRLNYGSYYTAYSLLNNAGSVIQIIIVMMVIMNKDNRGLHDYIANTEVVFIDNEEKEEVMEAEVIDNEVE